MLHEWLALVFSHPSARGSLVIAGKTSLIYLFLIIGLRLLGKRELGQMTIYDLVLIIILANAVQNAMVGSDTSLAGGIVAAGTLLLLNRALAALIIRSARVQAVMVGGPRLIVHNGKMLRDRMAKEGISQEQVMAALREHGINDISMVQMAVLEVDGTISVVPSAAGTFRTRHHFRAMRIG
ncbi:MAG: DUF421 domain-containing protein [Armatimonadetes bacterium]|nr:DUF421 domain-containing protein [Armatimonadota bacterium]MDE2207528.1 DUF421 domain-containing protein [Armatimonadota bacterium]